MVATRQMFSVLVTLQWLPLLGGAKVRQGAPQTQSHLLTLATYFPIIPLLVEAEILTRKVIQF